MATLLRITLLTICVVFAYYAGGASKADRTDIHAPVDLSGHTSIVIYDDYGRWCELRGPARFKFLADCTGFIQ